MDVRGATFILSRATKQRRTCSALSGHAARARKSPGTCPRPPRRSRRVGPPPEDERHAFDEGLGRTSSAKTPPRARGVSSRRLPDSHVARGFGLLRRLDSSPPRAGSVFSSSVFPIPASRGDVFPISTRAVRPRAPAIASPRAATAARAPRSRSSSPSARGERAHPRIRLEHHHLVDGGGRKLEHELHPRPARKPFRGGTHRAPRRRAVVPGTSPNEINAQCAKSSPRRPEVSRVCTSPLLRPRAMHAQEP